MPEKQPPMPRQEQVSWKYADKDKADAIRKDFPEIQKAADQQIEEAAYEVYWNKENGFNSLDDAWQIPKFRELIRDYIKDKAQKAAGRIANELLQGREIRSATNPEDEASLSEISNKIDEVKEATKYGITVETQNEISKKLIALGEKPLSEEDLDDLDNSMNSLNSTNKQEWEVRKGDVDYLLKETTENRAARLSEAKLIQEKGLDIKSYISKDKIKAYGNRFNRSPEEITDAISDIFHSEFGEQLGGNDRILEPDLLKKLEERLNSANITRENSNQINSRIRSYQEEMQTRLEKIDFIRGFNWGDKNEKIANDVAGRVANAIVANELTRGGRFDVGQRDAILSGVLSTLEVAENTNDGSATETLDSYVNPQELAKAERTIPTLVASYIDMIVGEPKIKEQEKTTSSDEMKTADPNMPGVGKHDYSNDNMGLPGIPKDFKVEPSAIADAINKAAQSGRYGKVTDL